VVVGLVRSLYISSSHVNKKEIEQLNKFCKHCQKHGKSPGRFRFKLRDELDFNFTIIVDVMFVDGDGGSNSVIRGYAPNTSSVGTRSSGPTVSLMALTLISCQKKRGLRENCGKVRQSILMTHFSEDKKNGNDEAKTKSCQCEQ
jgi:hypothetical protein